MRMNRLIGCLACFFCVSGLLQAQSVQRLYLLPGQGSDHRIYSHIQFPAGVDTVHLHFLTPEPQETMEQYALRMSAQVDTTQPFAFMGVSLGGMVSLEMADLLHPQKVILISSASSAEEVPELYTFFRSYPVYQYLPAGLFKYSTYLLQPLYEPDRSRERKTCNSMIGQKDALFMKQAVGLIVTWDRREVDNTGIALIQIHGSADHTLPLHQITADHIVPDGSHMMTLTRPEAVSRAIAAALLSPQ